MADKQNNNTNLVDPVGFNPQVQTAAGLIGKTTCKIFEATSGMTDPTGTVSESVAQFAKTAAPVVIGASKKMMENAHAQYETPAEKFLREHPLRSADGTPMTIEEGAQKAFEDMENPEEELDEYGVVKNQTPTQNNSGYSGGRKR